MTQTSTEKPTTIDMDRALQGIHYEKNVEIPTRDGSFVSANIFRPETEQQVPALLCYSIYAKDLHEQDGFPEIWADMLERLPNIFDHSTCSLHTHETNDPEIWCPWGYACVRVDVPGAGKSPGFLDPFSPTEARAGYDTVEWIADQPWCNGKVGMTGISYLAIAQWRVATEQPPHLAAIIPWEGVSDFYRDWNRHGGMLSTFFAGWYGMQAVRLQHGNAASPWFDLDDGAPIGGPGDLSEEELRANRMDPVAEFRANELDSPWWRDRSADFDRITVPLLSGANWGGNALHLRGNVEAFVRSASPQKWLEIHGGNHRDDYYLPAGGGAAAGVLRSLPEGRGQRLERPAAGDAEDPQRRGHVRAARGAGVAAGADAVDEALPRRRSGDPRPRPLAGGGGDPVRGARRRSRLPADVRPGDRADRPARGEAATSPPPRPTRTCSSP